jgi:7-carboxy-7-deazaguanine synthase
MLINEIFYSIQGEGKWTGIPNIFIRTSQCNLRCSYCDTKYAYEEGFEITLYDILKKIQEYPCKYVCITGGEPLLQKETIPLINLIQKKDYKILLETNGSINIKSIKNRSSLIISLDIKCPSSKMHDKMDYGNLKLLNKNDQVKFIIEKLNDYEFAKNVISNYEIPCDIYFQSLWGKNPKLLAKWILNDKLNVKLGLQIHKIIWGEKKGV